ncbi:MAG: 2-nitropropane dioxygenase [Oceanospirillaceae bacterium]|nr:2-nitropropane dioxygenase [Oceanospirillaceae bacterium]
MLLASESSFSTKLPIVQAPMAGVQNSALTIAVANAGGIGSLPCAMLTPDALASELEVIRAAGIKTYNLNFFCHQQPDPDTEREAKWRQALAPFYQEHGINSDDVPAGAGRLPFSEASLEVIRPYQPPIVSFHFGLPKADWLDEIKTWGGKVWSSATTLEEALWLEAHGADAVIVQGIEAGGHRGMFLTDDLDAQPGTEALLQAVLDAVNIPVIAAGGIASPEHVKAVLDKGAAAAQVGTAYLLCDEATTTPIHRELLKAEAAGFQHSTATQQSTATQPSTTRLTNLLSGRPARGLVNRLMDELGPISEAPPEFPLATAALVPLRAAAEKQGKGDFSPLWCGTDASGCREVSAAEQTQWLASLVE